MIKHGRIYKFENNRGSKQHLDPIKKFVTKGIADSKEKVVLKPQACDVKGARRHNPQQCVIAKCASRVLKPDAVAIGRSLAYLVFDGLAVRFYVPPISRRLVEEFDTVGRVRSLPIQLNPIFDSWKLGSRPSGSSKTKPSKKPLKRARKIGVRAVGGGKTV